MNVKLTRRLVALVPLVVLLLAAGVTAQGKITTPKEFLGFDAGDDYMLANYTQLKGYWEKLATESDRMKLVEIGKTAEGRPMIMAIFTSPENQKNLAHYKDIAQRLAHAEGLTDEQAKKLAAEGKAVVWIDSGLHATECIPSQHLFQIAYQMASRTDAETMRILNDVILLLVPINPDGMDLVSNWYMRNPDPKARNMNIPRLYQKYIGHDDNRDSYAVNQPETEAVSRQHFIEWFPEIVYNQHQSGPAGTVLFSAPFRDPFNYNYDPLVPEGIEVVASAMHQRFMVEGKPGAVQRADASYSTWFNGGIRTAAYFHNEIGILTEIIGNPTPMTIPFVLARQLPDGNQPYPIAPQQVWHQRQSIEYLITADRAILDLASRDREGFLYRSYVMGRNSIQRGSQDTWTITPKKIAAVQAAVNKDMGASAPREQGPTSGDSPMQAGGGRGGGLPAKYRDLLHDPAKRDPRGFIIPSDQPDFLTATKFVNALLKSGITIHRATAAFQIAGKTYPAGSYVVKAAQAFRPHIMDMFEPQDHPDDIAYPGGPPRPPYDATGWTLAFQMGVKFDRILEGFDGPFEKVPGLIKVAPGKIVAMKGAVGYVLNHEQNDTFVATNRLLAAKEEVYWLKSSWKAGAMTYPSGAIYVPAKATTKAALDKIAADLGITVDAVTVRPTGEALKLKPVRIALWDRYGGSMDSGWIRWMFEQAFPTTFELVYAQALDAGDLNAKYDVIIFPGGSIPAFSSEGGGRRGGGGGFGGNAASIPDEFKSWVGSITADKTIPQLRKFVENGGTIIAIGSGTSVAGHFGLAVSNHLVERQPNGSERRLGTDKFYVPGSILQLAVDPTDPLAFGVGSRVDAFYDNDPVFRLDPDAALKGVETGRMVRLEDAAAQRLGMGPGLPRRRRGDGRGGAWQGQGVPVRAGDHLPRPAARHVQVPLQRDSTTDRRPR